MGRKSVTIERTGWFGKPIGLDQCGKGGNLRRYALCDGGVYAALQSDSGNIHISKQPHDCLSQLISSRSLVAPLGQLEQVIV